MKKILADHIAQRARRNANGFNSFNIHFELNIAIGINSQQLFELLVRQESNQRKAPSSNPEGLPHAHVDRHHPDGKFALHPIDAKHIVAGSNEQKNGIFCFLGYFLYAVAELISNEKFSCGICKEVHFYSEVITLGFGTAGQNAFADENGEDAMGSSNVEPGFSSYL